jgi:hypothetical protein
MHTGQNSTGHTSSQIEVNTVQDNFDTDKLDHFISLLLDQRLSKEEEQQLNILLETSPAAVLHYRSVLDTHSALSEIFLKKTPTDNCPSPQRGMTQIQTRAQAQNASIQKTSYLNTRQQVPLQWVTAICISLIIGTAGYMLGKREMVPREATPHTTQGEVAIVLEKTSADNEPRVDTTWGGIEPTLRGHAILRKTFDISWPHETPGFIEGSLLEPGAFVFESGIAVIDFFCGATLVIEGPAQLDVISDWVVSIDKGRVEATVPPAAQGFIVKAANTDIIDLGTTFALDMSQGKAQVAVIDGEVILRGEQFDDDHLQAGEQALLDPATTNSDFLPGIPRLDVILRESADSKRKRYAAYQSFIEELASDPRLIALFPAEPKLKRRRLPNIALTEYASPGQLIGPAETVPGRFGNESVGVLLSRPGSRIRTKIKGTFSAYTFSCWVKIHSLKHEYNALFLSDGYENGEPHWQIRHDGKLMFSVMVDDSRELFYSTGPTSPPIQDKGFHHVYFSKPFWSPSMTDQWVHLAAVYDPAAQIVSQYVNGKAICQETIQDEFVIDDLHIGNAEIGNWGQPFRKTPDFAVRNFDGIIDEMIILNAALSPDEIRDIYIAGSVY